MEEKKKTSQRQRNKHFFCSFDDGDCWEWEEIWKNLPS